MESKWYKVLNSTCKHHGFQYKIGLNTDHIKFKPSGSCSPGGLYYTNKENLHKFLIYGCYIADVEVPSDAQVYKEPGGTKWKADKLIIKSITRFEDHPLFNDLEWCIKAVNHDCFALEYAKVQSEEMCLVAVKQNGLLLRYVINQTPEVCKAAIKNNHLASYYVIKN